MKRLVIAHSVFNWLPVTQTWIYSQVDALTDKMETHILCNRKENIEQFQVANLHCMEDIPRDLCFILNKILGKVLGRRRHSFWHNTSRCLNPSVWHSHFADQAWIDRQVVEESKAKHVLSVYGADISQLPNMQPWDRRIPEVLEQVDMVLCEGPFMAKQVIGLGCPPERAMVHHLGVRLECFPFRPRRWQDDSPLRVLIAGTFREKKGITYALEALARIAEDVRLEITVVGDAYAKPGDALEKKRILSVIERRKLRSKTRLLGFQPYASLLEEALQHHIFLSPSVQAADGDNEGGAPVIITEMAASGMMIVSSRHCDIPEVIPDGKAGLLADEKDVDGLTDHLRWLIRNPDKWSTMQSAAREHIEREYNWRIQGEKLAAVYAELAAC